MRSDRQRTDAGPSSSLEVEITFDVDDATALPDWGGVDSVAAVDAPEIRKLDARYFDTAGRDLALARYALRRRAGGPDEGWHLKGPRVGDGRIEIGWPLDDAPTTAVEQESVPAVIREYVATIAPGALMPLARIRNHRTAYVLRAADGGVLAEFVDDRVSSIDERSGRERAWREWEVELGPSAPPDPEEFFTAVRAAVAAVGGRAASSDSKLARALGF